MYFLGSPVQRSDGICLSNLGGLSLPAPQHTLCGLGAKEEKHAVIIRHIHFLRREGALIVYELKLRLLMYNIHSKGQ